MDVKRFVDDDHGYQGWTERHPKGYVLNCRRKPNATYLVLHRASCATITVRSRGVRWTQIYIKVCSDSIERLVKWAALETDDGHPTSCKLCCPL